MSSQVWVSAGPRPPAGGLWPGVEGGGGGGGEVEAALISAAHDKGSPSDSSLLARTKFFINTLASTPSHRRAGEKMLTEEKRKKKPPQQLHSRRRGVRSTAENNYDSFSKIHNPPGGSGTICAAIRASDRQTLPPSPKRKHDVIAPV